VKPSDRTGAAPTSPRVAVTDPTWLFNHKYWLLSSIYDCDTVRHIVHMCVSKVRRSSQAGGGDSHQPRATGYAQLLG
jgi:hypothetical protein